MWPALRELFSSLSPKRRFWLAIVIILALLALILTITLTGSDSTPWWAILGG